MVKSREGERAEKSICLDLSRSLDRQETRSWRRVRHCRTEVLTTGGRRELGYT